MIDEQTSPVIPDSRLNRVLNAWADAAGGKARLAGLSAAELQGVAQIGLPGNSGICGTAQMWYTAGGDFRVDILLSGCNALMIVFNYEQGAGWLMDGDGNVSDLPRESLAVLIGQMYLLTYSWLFTDRLPGKILLLPSGPQPQQFVLEALAAGGTPYNVRLGTAVVLPEEVSYEVGPLPPLPEADEGQLRLLPAGGLFHLGNTSWSGPVSLFPEEDQSERGPSAEHRSIDFQGWQTIEGIQFPSQLLLLSSKSSLQTLLNFGTVTVNPQLPPDFFAKPSSRPARVGFGGAPGEQVPFDLVTNNVFVAATVNGSAPLSFGLDTGTSGLVFDTSVVQRLGIPCVCRYKSVLGGGSDPTLVCVTPSATVRVGRFQAISEGMAVDLGGLSHDKVGQAVDGILGGTLLTDVVVVIDYPAGTVTFGSTGPKTADDGGVKIPMSLSGSVPFVQAKLTLPDGEVEALLLVDTGTQEAIILNQPFVEKHNLLKTVSTLISTVDFGLGGEVPYDIGRLALAQLGSLKIDRPVVNFATAAVGSLGSSAFDGFLGASVLKRCRATFDYPGRVLALQPGDAFDAPYEYGMSGMVLTAQTPQFNVFTVAYVIADSPASEVDIQVGDVITSIDARPASALTLSEIKTMFLQPDHRYLLGLSRGTLERKVEIQTRRLI